jgi:uncharacterized lipoprotein YddW (UPF0748 family)
MHVTRATISIGIAALLLGMAGAKASTPRGAFDVRALWVTRTTLASPATIRSMIRDAADAGFTDLLVQVRGRGDALYTSSFEPRAAELAGQPAAFDPLRMVLDLAREKGVRVHAWVNVNLVASAVRVPTDRRHIVRRHPEWLMVPSALEASLTKQNPKSGRYLDALAAWTRKESDRVEGLYLSPILPEARAYSTSIVRDIVTRYAVDGLHLDYIRYPSDAFDHSRNATAAFAGPNAEWADFRRDRLTDLVSSIVAAARQARPGLTISAAVVPAEADARERKLQDWPAWLRTGLIDVVCPMIYSVTSHEFGATLEAMTASTDVLRIWPGIGAYRLPVEQTTLHIGLARRSGARGLVLFSYENLAGSGTRGDALAAFATAMGSGAPIGGR